MLRASRKKKKHKSYGKSIRLTADFSVDILKAKRSWNNTSKPHGCYTTLPHPEILSVAVDEENNLP